MLQKLIWLYHDNIGFSLIRDIADNLIKTSEADKQVRIRQ